MKESYISYFQSVITLGILSDGGDPDDALSKAKKNMENSDGVNHCFFDQTPFESVATEIWNPELESTGCHDGLSFNFNPSEETKNVIATRLHKDVKDLTNEDFETFVKESIQLSLSQLPLG